MKTVIILMLFIGLFFIANGVYEQKIKALEENPKIVYKFVPRTYYEEQLYGESVSTKMTDMFHGDQPWFMENSKKMKS